MQAALAGGSIADKQTGNQDAGGVAGQAPSDSGLQVGVSAIAAVCAPIGLYRLVEFFQLWTGQIRLTQHVLLMQAALAEGSIAAQ
jgi:hypothetical protein